MLEKLQKIRTRLTVSESILSFVLGVLVVLLAAGVVYKYLHSINNGAKPGSASSVTSQNTDGQFNGDILTGSSTVALPTTHQVKPGETLWSIAETYYHSSYNWVDIAQANPEVNPQKIFSGTTINIPKVEAKATTLEMASEVKITNGITTSSYTVVKGDTLWSISLRSYGDPYRWPQIAKANNLQNPNLIHPGNNLMIPR